MSNRVKEIEEISTSYLKLGKKLFAVKEVNANCTLETELKDYYSRKVDDITKALKDSVSEGFSSDWQAQLSKLREERDNISAKIPLNMFNKYVMWDERRKQLVWLRLAMYHPTEHLTTKSELESHSINLDDKLPSRLGANTPIVVTVKTDIYWPILIGFNDKSKRVFNYGADTFHTFSDRHMCIGNARYEDYMALSDKDLSAQISRTNWFSTAAGAIPLNTGQFGYTYFINAEKVISIVRRGTSEWTTATA